MITHDSNLIMHACYTATVFTLVKVHKKTVELTVTEGKRRTHFTVPT